MNMELIYEYGSRAGFWRLWRMFTERELPVTVFGVATAMRATREAVAAMQGGRLGDRQPRPQMDRVQGLRAEEERAHLREAVRIHTEVTGEPTARLVHGPHLRHTLRLVMEEGGFVYCADSYADELPYWVDGPNGPQLIVPYTLDANDMRFATPQGFNAGDQFFAYLKDSFDVLYAEGEGAPKMMSVGLHCRLVGTAGPGRGTGAIPRLRDRARARLGGAADRHRPPLARAPPTAHDGSDDPCPSGGHLNPSPMTESEDHTMDEHSPPGV